MVSSRRTQVVSAQVPKEPHSYQRRVRRV
eukprot:IDg4336t1